MLFLVFCFIFLVVWFIFFLSLVILGRKNLLSEISQQGHEASWEYRVQGCVGRASMCDKWDQAEQPAPAPHGELQWASAMRKRLEHIGQWVLGFSEPPGLNMLEESSTGIHGLKRREADISRALQGISCGPGDHVRFSKQEWFLFYFPFCARPAKVCLLRSVGLKTCLQGKEYCSFCADLFSSLRRIKFWWFLCF